MTIELKLTAEKRTDLGKGASRRLRRAKQVPVILYGGKRKAQTLQVPEQQLLRLLEEEAFYSQILTLEVEGKTENVVLKDMQRHAYKPRVLHLDLQRVLANVKLTSQIPLRLVNDEALRKAGNNLFQDLMEVTIECLPKNLPEVIEVDCSELEPGDTLHLSALKLPKGVTIPALAQGADYDTAVVSVVAPRAESVADEEGAEEAGDESKAEEDGES